MYTTERFYPNEIVELTHHNQICECNKRWFSPEEKETLISSFIMAGWSQNEVKEYMNKCSCWVLRLGTIEKYLEGDCYLVRVLSSKWDHPNHLHSEYTYHKIYSHQMKSKFPDMKEYYRNEAEKRKMEENDFYKSFGKK